MNIAEKLRGSLVALVTPMNEDGSIDWDSAERLIEWHIAQGTRAIVAVGTTGESPTLSHQEHKQFLSYTIEKVNSRIPVVAGAGSNSTAEAIELAAHAKQAGADATMQIVPYYNKPTQNGLIKHFSEIADNVDLGHIIYNVPSRTITDIQPETIAEVADHKNIIGVKEATGEIDRVERIKSMCDDNFVILSGDDITCCELILAGGHGCISVTANIAPSQLQRLCELAGEGKEAEARNLQERLMPLHQALFVEANPIPLKYAMSVKSKIKNSLRLPLTPLSESHRPQLESALKILDEVD